VEYEKREYETVCRKKKYKNCANVSMENSEKVKYMERFEENNMCGRE
jgi:hypothetical protein